MYLEKVKDLENINLGPNLVLVEFIEKKSTIILAGSDGPSSTLIREEIFLSNAEGLNKGDIILEAKYGNAGDARVHTLIGKKEVIGEGKDKRTITIEDRKFAVLQAYEIKMWTSAENFNK